MGHALTIDSAVEPVTLAEAKAHLRIETEVTDEDTFVGSLIKASRLFCEHKTRRVFIDQTWTLTFDAGFPS